MKPTAQMILAARKELKRRAAKQSLAHFILYTTPGYLMGWVHQEICDRLDKFLDDVVNHRSPRLIICMPPRSGKSQIVSRAFPAYAFGRHPDLSVIATSYSSDLSSRFSRDVQRYIDSEQYAKVFPGTRLSVKGESGYLRTSEFFEVVNHKGSYRSAGVGGGITGMGADCLLVDDVVKDRQAANSQTVRDSTWDWYTSTAYTRLSPGGGVIVMLTRWHLDDLVGRLLEQEREGGEKWQIINYPAIAEQDEPHRKTGEALHPERYPIDALLRIKQAVGSNDWNALYQQHPVPATGSIFKREWIQHWSADSLPTGFEATCISWDMTFKDSDKSDYVVGQVWGRKNGAFYLLDQVRGQWSFVQSLNQVQMLAEKYPRIMRKLIEDKANGSAIIDALKDVVPGITPVTPKESKEARASAITPLFEAHNVYLPPPDRFPWVKDALIPELLTFPSGAHDDQVDSLSQALSHLHQTGVWKFSPANRSALMQGFRR